MFSQKDSRPPSSLPDNNEFLISRQIDLACLPVLRAKLTLY